LSDNPIFPGKKYAMAIATTRVVLVVEIRLYFLKNYVVSFFDVLIYTI
jgi:hypothetical protein